MNLLQYITVTVISTVLSWVAWLFLLIFVDPFSAPFVLKLLFYLSLFIAAASTFSLGGLVARVFVLKRKMIPYEATTSFRQGILFSTLLVACLFLSSKNLLTWWLIAILVVLLLTAEFFFVSTRRI